MPGSSMHWYTYIQSFLQQVNIVYWLWSSHNLHSAMLWAKYKPLLFGANFGEGNCKLKKKIAKFQLDKFCAGI